MASLKLPLPSRERDNFIQAGKAIHDSLRETLPREIIEQVKSSLRDELSADLTKAFNDRLADHETEMVRKLDRMMENHKAEVLKVVADKITEFGEYESRRLDLLVKDINEKTTTQLRLFKDQILTWLQSQPPPQVTVNVPENAIEVKQLPSVVNVDAPQVIVEAAPPRRTRKVISYNVMGQPEVIEEVEAESGESVNFDDLKTEV
jgi:hypothetical protein